jgi:transposase
MPQTCKACKHPQRAAIDAALARGESLRDIAGRFGISDTSICRHKAHNSASIVKASERREERFGMNLADELLRINRKAWELLAKMEADGDHRGSVVALREVRECVATQDEMLSRAMKLQVATEPPQIEVVVRDISQPAIPRLPQ